MMRCSIQHLHVFVPYTNHFVRFQITYAISNSMLNAFLPPKHEAYSKKCQIVNLKPYGMRFWCGLFIIFIYLFRRPNNGAVFGMWYWMLCWMWLVTLFLIKFEMLNFFRFHFGLVVARLLYEMMVQSLSWFWLAMRWDYEVRKQHEHFHQNLAWTDWREFCPNKIR